MSDQEIKPIKVTFFRKNFLFFMLNVILSKQYTIASPAMRLRINVVYWHSHNKREQKMAYHVALFLVAPLNKEESANRAQLASLSPAEQATAAQFLQEERRQQWVMGRALLRREVHRRYPDHPLEIHTDEHGKPWLEGIHFNMSHSADWLVLALCQEGAVGIDLELGRRRRDLQRLASRFFAPEEAQWLAEQPAEQRDHLFYRFWARKEAVLKANGGGLSAGLERVSFDPKRAWQLENLLDEKSYVISDSPCDSGWLALATEEDHRIALHWLDTRLENIAPLPHVGISL